MSRRRAKGLVFKRNGTWYYEVSDGKKVVLSDNSGNFRVVFNQCLSSVLAADRVLGAGHRFKHSYGEIVERYNA